MPQHHNIWHYHEELEFIIVLRGSGKLFIGDCIKEFSAGDSFLIGANIPHYWLFDTVHTSTAEENIDCIVAHFKQNCLGNEFIHLPEASIFKELLVESKRALHTQIETKHELASLFEKTLEATGLLKIMSLLETLLTFKKTGPIPLISSQYVIVYHSDDVRRMNVIMEFIRENFTTKIELDVLAQLAQMTKNSFSRYFKQKTGKTPIQLIFELRISHACKLLRNPDYSLKEICYDSGFNNAVSFHKVFRNIMQMTPIQYRHGFLEKRVL